ncbi:MAG: aldehyde ferredoxin oxidoreductase family protein [Candidatus Odinarchaeota archaeon]
MALWRRKRLHIDLTEEKAVIQDIPEEILSKYVGGIGLGSYYLWKEVPPRVDPLGDKNCLYFCTGPAQGSEITMTGRYCLVTKSPLSGLLMDSHAGGNVGSEISFLGYDVISISGKSEKPVYIFITDNGNVEINRWDRGAGKTTHETEKILKSVHDTPDLRVISTGPAGEKLVPYACLVNDTNRNLGRGGGGAVFGAKNLKAIALKSSDRTLLKNELTGKLATEIKDRIKGAREAGHLLHHQGTPWLVNLANSFSMYPTRNFQTGYFDDHDKINGEALERYKTKKRGCFRCNLGCTFFIKDHGFSWTNDDEVAVPEYETLGLLGGNLGINDLETIIRMNHQCNTLGLDSISTGASLSFLAELKEKNMLPPELAGYNDQVPTFGDVNGFNDLLLQIPSRTKLAEFVSLGPAAMAEKCPEEASDFAIHVKKLPMAAWDPRGKFLMGLSYATAAIGASHLRGWSMALQPPFETFDLSISEHQRGFEAVVEQVDLKLLKDTLIICHFTHSIRPPYQVEDARRFLHALTGNEWSMDETRELAHRIWIVQRLFNTQEMDDDPVNYDTLPGRMMKESMDHDPAKGCFAFTSEEDFREVLNLYYKHRGLDESGRPLQGTLKALGI